MKLSSLALALLAVAASPTLVASEADPQETSLQPVRAVLAPPKPIGGYKALKLLALETDLTTHDVRLVLTTEVRNARYDFRSDLNKARQFESSLGSERYSDLIAGRPIELHSPAVLEAARNMAATADGWTRDGQFAVVVSAAP